MLHAIFLPLFALVFSKAAYARSVVRIDDSPVKIPISVSINQEYAKNLVQNDRMRVRALIQNALRQTEGHDKSLVRRGTPQEVIATNAAVKYTVVVDIGNPPTQYNLLIDTGSANTWVGANQAYVQTSTSYKTNNNVSVLYGSGDFTGVEYLDQFALGSTLLIYNQSIGVATESDGFDGIDGILGMGPDDLTIGSLSPDTNRSVPTVTDNLYRQKSIPRKSFAIAFEPTTSLSNTNGELIFGAGDPNQHVGSITYTPMVDTGDAAKYWGIQQSITYGASRTLVNEGTGFFDTGTTLLLLNDNAFDNYVAATGASLDPSVGLLKISEQQYSNLKSLHFIINDTTFEFTPNAQIWPRPLNTALGGNSSDIYLIVSSLGSAAEGSPNVQFVNGYTFLERFYTEYDISGRRIGIARTKYTHAETN